MNTPLASARLLDVLSTLADGSAMAPDALAARHGLSLDALRQALPQLADHGVRERSDGRLRIPGGLELLDAQRIAEALAARGAELPVTVVGVTGSTNDDARQALADGRRPPFAILAEAQSAGRGRRGRAWDSPVASNLYVTVVEPLRGGPESSRGLSLAVGVAVAEGLGRSTGIDPALKWPNDLLVDGRKLGGILVELAPGDGSAVAIIGVGLNVRVPDYVGTGIDQAWTDLARSGGGRVSRNEVAAAVLAAIGAQLTRFRESGFDTRTRARWQARDPYFDQRIVARSEAFEFEGVGRGIDRDGELLIDTGQVVERVGAGEVSIRLAGTET